MNNEALEEFKTIMHEEYGVELSDEQAIEDATAFLQSFKLVASDLIHKQPIDTQEGGYGNVTTTTS